MRYVPSRLVVRLSMLAVLAAFFPLPSCNQQSRPAVETQPASTKPAPQAAVVPEPPPQPAEPKRPKHPWVIFRTAQDEKADASITANWTGGTRLEIVTENVNLVTLDLNKLPPEAPKKGPWNLQIDKQGIQIYGKPGMRVLDISRSRNGDWAVVEGSHRVRP